MENDESVGWGWLPQLCITTSVGLLVIAFADQAGISGEDWSEFLFWLGILVILIPFAFRLVMSDSNRRERIALVGVLGLALYLVKFMHSPFAFTFSDEFIHLANVNAVWATNHLFNDNSILRITPLYPGLQSVVSALGMSGGLTPFQAGVVVIGAARLVLVLSLYLFFEEISGSPRIAGLGTLLYMLNANFIFFLAQLSYQSLALPLGLFFLFILSRRTNEEDRLHRLAFDLVALLVLGAVVITHHLTTYALVGFLWLFTVMFRIFSKGDQKSPWVFAVIATIFSLSWLTFVARLTLDYLVPLFSDAITSAIKFVTGQESGRELYRSTTGYLAPLWERITGTASIVVLLLGMPSGLVQIWRRYRDNPFALTLGLIAPAYFALLLLRFTGAGWEIANRSSMFLFIALAFVIAVGIVRFQLPAQSKWMPGWVERLNEADSRRVVVPAVLAALIAFVFVGGVIAGWPPNDRLPRPYAVSIGSQVVNPPGVFAAQWVKTFLGTGNHIAADGSNARLLLTYGQRNLATGDDSQIRQMLAASQVDQAVVDALKGHGIEYVIFDRRRISADHMVGTFFDRKSDVDDGTVTLYDTAVYRKFDSPSNVNRIFDGGNIVIYDVRGLNASK